MFYPEHGHKLSFLDPPTQLILSTLLLNDPLAKEKFGVEYEGPVNNFVANFHDAVSFSCRIS